jgi:hypothetical protein
VENPLVVQFLEAKHLAAQLQLFKETIEFSGRMAEKLLAQNVPCFMLKPKRRFILTCGLLFICLSELCRNKLRVVELYWFISAVFFVLIVP